MFSKILQYMLILIGTLYITCTILFAILCTKSKNKTFILILPFIFLILHLSYGIGFLNGLLDFVLFNKFNNKYAISNR